MATNHKVIQGECLSSIGYNYGLFPDTIWLDPGNDQLRNERKNADVLLEGDLVSIPEKRLHDVAASTAMRHRFLRKGVPAKIRLRLLLDDEPRANEGYVLEVEGQSLVVRRYADTYI